MEEKILYQIREKLKKLDVNYGSLKPFMQERLYELESCILRKMEQYRIGVEMINNSAFTVSSIAEDIKCARTTLYNHDQLLKCYIEVSVEEYKDLNIKNKVENLEDEIRLLNNRIKLMEIRDIEVEAQKIENKQLEVKLRSLKKDNEKLFERLAILNSENMKLKRSIIEIK